MLISSQIDDLAMKQDQLRDDVMQEFDEMNAHIDDQTRQLLADNAAQTDEILAAQNETAQRQLEVLERNRLRLQQQQGKMMQSIQCNTELQYEKMLDKLDESVDHILSEMDEDFVDMKK